MSRKLEENVYQALASAGPAVTRILAGDVSGEDGDSHGDDSGFGVHIPYEDLYASIIFFVAIYAVGSFTQKFLKMPSLVGEIFTGIVLGPPVANFVPNPVAFVMLGEIG